MRSYVVMLPGGGAATAPASIPEPEDWRLLADGFSKLALIFPVLWLLWHRLWLPAFTALVVPLGAPALAGALGADQGTQGLAYGLASLAVGVLAGLEGRAAVIAKAERKGARTVGVIEASSREEAEDKLAALAAGDGPAPVRATPPPPPPRRYGRPRPDEATATPRAAPLSLVPLGGR